MDQITTSKSQQVRSSKYNYLLILGIIVGSAVLGFIIYLLVKYLIKQQPQGVYTCEEGTQIYPDCSTTTCYQTCAPQEVFDCNIKDCTPAIVFAYNPNLSSQTNQNATFFRMSLTDTTSTINPWFVVNLQSNILAITTDTINTYVSLDNSKMYIVKNSESNPQGTIVTVSFPETSTNIQILTCDNDYLYCTQSAENVIGIFRASKTPTNGNISFYDYITFDNIEWIQGISIGQDGNIYILARRVPSENPGLFYFTNKKGSIDINTINKMTSNVPTSSSSLGNSGLLFYIFYNNGNPPNSFPYKILSGPDTSGNFNLNKTIPQQQNAMTLYCAFPYLGNEN